LSTIPPSAIKNIKTFQNARRHVLIKRRKKLRALARVLEVTSFVNRSYYDVAFLSEIYYVGFPFFDKIFISQNTKQNNRDSPVVRILLYQRNRKHAIFRFESFHDTKRNQNFVMNRCETKRKRSCLSRQKNRQDSILNHLGKQKINQSFVMNHCETRGKENFI
jgi:hypothetical protein